MSFCDQLIAFILRARQIRGQVDDLEAEIVKGIRQKADQEQVFKAWNINWNLKGGNVLGARPRVLFSKHHEKIYL